MKNYITGQTRANKRNVERDILVEGCVHTVAIPAVIVSTVHEEKFDQMVELTDDIIGVVDCGIAFLALHAHSHGTLTNHRDIVGSITNGQAAQALVLHQHDNTAFLFGTHAAADHCCGVLDGKAELLLREPD